MKKKISYFLILINFVLISNILNAQWNIGGNTLTAGASSNNFGSINNYGIDFMTNNIDRMTLTNQGRLGIGTSSPGGYLTVFADGNATKPQLLLTENASDFVRLKFTNSTVANTHWMMASLCHATSADSSKIKFIYTTAAGSNDLFTITGAGNVGIGTTTPSARLYVYGPPTFNEISIYAKTNYFGPGITALAINGVSEGGLGTKIGVYGFTSGGGDQNIGVKGEAINSAQLNIGVYGRVDGSAPVGYAGYFEGDTYVSGNVMIGSVVPATGYMLSVAGKIMCEELKVQLEASWPDYVFDENYTHLSINELSDYLDHYNHLPLMPSAEQVNQNGIEIGEMQQRTVEQLEVAMLYIIELQKQIDELKAQYEGTCH